MTQITPMPLYINKFYLTNVTNVLNPQKTSIQLNKENNEIATDIKFLSVVEEALQDGDSIPMSNLHGAYKIIVIANCVLNPLCKVQR